MRGNGESELSANILTPGLTFDADKHVYTDASGRRLLSVTQVIERAGLVQGMEFFTEEARDRGRAVHSAIHYLDDGDLDEESIHPVIRPYLDAYRKWQAETQAQSLFSEIALADVNRGFAGTLDSLCWMPMVGPDLFLVDFKSGEYQHCSAVQIAAYRELVRVNLEVLGLKANELPRSFRVLQLKPNGKYTLHAPKITMTEALAYFMSALNIVRFQETYHGC